MVQVVYKRRRVKTELPQPSTQRAAAPAPEAQAETKELRPRLLHLKQYGITSEKTEQLTRMQDELDALRRKRES